MSHMQPQIVGPTDWWEVETTDGTYWVQCEDVGYKNVVTVDLMPYLPIPDTNRLMRWEFKSGYGARLSAPGYLDCTDWVVFDTEKEARDYLSKEHELCPLCLGDLDGSSDCIACFQNLTTDELLEALTEFMLKNVTMQELVIKFWSELYEKYNNETLRDAYQKKVTDYHASS